jgi:hypothetical protein
MWEGSEEPLVQEAKEVVVVVEDEGSKVRAIESNAYIGQELTDGSL